MKPFRHLLFTFFITLILPVISWGDCSGSNDGTWNTSSSTTYSDNGSARSYAQDYYVINLTSGGNLSIAIDDDDSASDDNIVVNVYGDSSCNTSIWSDSTTTKYDTGTLNFNQTLSAGTYVLHIAGSSTAKSNYSFSGNFLADGPAINLQGNGNDISNGDTSPTTWDDTDFGSISLGNSVTHTFTIENPGTQTLVLTNSPLVTASGDFTVTSQPSTNSIAPGGSTSFEVTFSPTDYGNRSGSISIANNVSASNPYTFSVRGEGLDPILSCPGRVISNLDGTAVSATDSDSGTIPSDTSYYYHFTPATDGTFQVDSSMSGSDRNDLYIYSDCSSSSLDSSTSDSYNKSLTYDVANGQQIIVRYRSTSGRNRTFNLNFAFTAFVATAVDDSYSVIKNTTFTGNVFDNDSGPTIIITSKTQPAHGTLSLDTSDGSFSYTPDTDYKGSDSFEYTITDTNGATATATVTFTVAEVNIQSTGGRAFELRHQENLFGDVKVIGNTVLCILNSNGVCTEPASTSNDSNAETTLEKAPVSLSTLDIPTNAIVKYARLYWQGRLKANATSDWSSDLINNAKQIKLRKGSSGAFTSLTADIIDLAQVESREWVRTYSASADAIDVVDAAGIYSIDPSSFITYEGRSGSDNPDDGLGAYGAWMLVVVYEDPDSTEAKNVTLFDGYQIIQDGNQTNIPTSGFLTPKVGDVDSMVYVFTAEGDRFLKNTGDVINMGGATFNTNLQTLGTFDSSVNVSATRNPNLTNNNGIDIHAYNVGTTPGASNIITNNETGASFQFTSDQDTYFPSVIVFSTQLYLPQMCYDYSIKQDGHYLKLDRTTSTIASVTGRISSSPLEIEVYLRNQEADLPAEGIAFRTDLNTSLFSQIGDIFTSNTNGSILFDRGTPQSTSPLCAYNLNGDNSLANTGCTDGHNIRKGNGTLDAYDYIYTKFSIKPNTSGLSDLNESLGLSVKYYITANGTKIEYPDYVLGGPNVPICPPSDAYIPEFGQFNVVSNGSIYNNLNTQISRKPFDVDVIFDSDPSTGVNDAPTSDLNSTVLVEIIDVDAFGDLNASCANPDAAVSAWPVFVPLQYTPSLWQTQVPPQPSSFFNFATQNATYRVWYFDDGNGTLIENWTANTANNGKDLLSISGLYNSSVHTVCAAACSDDTNVGCFTCIRDNYAKPLCARDNFSVRPESYDMRVYDINNSLPTYDIATDSTNVKNTTKVDLSTLHNQIPSQPIITGTPLELAAGYDYRYDVNATGFDSLNGIPGYTREFSTSSDYNVTMYWNGPNGTVCNDTSDLSLSFYIANGVLMNQEEQHTNVGDYFVNIIDRTWTIVDWDSSLMTHHLNGGFNPVQEFDCDTTSSTTVTNGLHGCTITSNQPTAGSGIYRDIPLTFHPYTFDITNTLSVGPENKPLSDKSFVYMNNIDNDENMSVHLNSFVTARGLSNANALTNFVTGCYATDVNFTIGKSTTTANNIAYRYIAHDLNATGDRIVGADLNGTIAAGNTTGDPLLLVPSTYWNKNMNGVLNLETNLNFNRAVNVAVNPEDINFTTLQADDNATLFNADLISNKTANGSVAVGQSVKHYYGATRTPKVVTVVCNTLPCRSGIHSSNDSSTQEFIWFAIYCENCNTSLLPIGNGSTSDSRWRTNNAHDINVTAGTDGIIGTISDELGSGTITETSRPLLIPNYQYETILEYNGPLPYDAQMLMRSSPWLIYDDTDPNAIENPFTTQFIGGGGWSGMYEEDSTTKTTNGAQSGRIMW